MPCLFSPPLSIIAAEDFADRIEAFITNHHNIKGEWKTSESKQLEKGQEARTLSAIKYVNNSKVHGKYSLIRWVSKSSAPSCQLLCETIFLSSHCISI